MYPVVWFGCTIAGRREELFAMKHKLCKFGRDNWRLGTWDERHSGFLIFREEGVICSASWDIQLCVWWCLVLRLVAIYTICVDRLAGKAEVTYIQINQLVQEISRYLWMTNDTPGNIPLLSWPHYPNQTLSKLIQISPIPNPLTRTFTSVLISNPLARALRPPTSTPKPLI